MHPVVSAQPQTPVGRVLLSDREVLCVHHNEFDLLIYTIRMKRMFDSIRCQSSSLKWRFTLTVLEKSGKGDK
jgi:hypothetical protein